MSGITVELNELDADLWEAFRRGGAWVAHSEYMRVVAENTKLRELVVRMYKYIRWSDMTSSSMFSVAHSYEKDMRELGIEEDR